jgi:hypothetical protein
VDDLDPTLRWLLLLVCLAAWLALTHFGIRRLRAAP